MNAKIEQKLFELIDFAKENNLAELTWQEKGKRISFKRGPVAKKQAQKSVAPAPEKPKEIPQDFIVSPIVGTFRRSLTKNRPPMVMKGNKVKPGDRLGVVECMKIPNEVLSFCSGEIQDVLVEDGQTVEYGQKLFAVSVSTNGSSKNGKSHVS